MNAWKTARDYFSMNIRRLNQLRLTAKRTLKILDLLEEAELTIPQIAKKVDANRQLVEYYEKQLNRKD